MEKTNTNTNIETLIWEFIHTYFNDNPQALVNHHVESYNDFFEQGIRQIFREKNPLKWTSQYDEELEDYRSQCIMYMGGRDGSKIYFGKPVIYDNDKPHFMFPNEARLRNMTYSMTVHYDIEIEFLNILPVNHLEEVTSGNNLEEIVGGAQLVHGDSDDDMDGVGDIPVDYVHGGAPPLKKTTKKPKLLEAVTPSEGKAIREYIEQSVTKDDATGRIIQRRTMSFENIYLGKFPIMVQSNFCVLHGMPREARYTMGECRNDPGGYFIIDGKEKVVIPQEKFGDNMMYIRKGLDDGEYLYSCEIRSVSENVTKPIRTLSVRMLAPTKKYTNGQIVVNIPNVRAPIPLFILFRALGILSDRDIMSTVLLDMEAYESLHDVFVPSIHDGGVIYTQRNAIEYIAFLTKGKAFHHGLEILADYFLPHVGEVNYREKAMFLGYMVFRMLSVHAGYELPTDRDNFKYKRMELPGILIHELFREYYNIQLKRIHLDFERQLKLNSGLYERDLPRLIQDHYRDIFREGGKMVEDGFKKAFKGNWGAYSHTKRVGVIQDLNRLSFNTMISHLRKTNLPIDSGLKIVGPRLCHNSQWGFIDPLDTPDGGNIGIHKHLAIATTVSRGYSRTVLVEWLREMVGMRMVTDYIPQELATVSKVIVNGYWAGCVTDPIPTVEKIRTYRRNAMLPIHTSVTFDFKLNTLFLYTDAGRLCRPIFYTDVVSNSLSCFREEVMKNKGKLTWEGLTRGLKPKKTKKWDGLYTRLYDLYEEANETMETDTAKLTQFLKHQAVIDYIDSSETENTMISINIDEYQRTRSTDKIKAQYTHCEIHESLMFGVMTNQIPYPETNPPARNLFSCGQSKQACSLYHTNYQMRMDKTAVVLHYGQIPLVRQRYGEYINREENPYGFNAIVAVACLTGYNVEDAILVNAGSLARGMFRTTYYTSYSAHEEKGDPANSGTELAIDHKFTNIESMASNMLGMRPGYDYSQLDQSGLIREGTPVTEKTILIGLTASSGSVASKEKRTDASVKPKRGQVGYVDKTYMTEGEEGERVAKVRIREERIPTLGDKMASRVGQKGTVGMVIPERDMPFTKEGIRPDLIINPHALPSRMTIGQLIESLTGKICTIKGAFADSTAFGQKGVQTDLYGRILQESLEKDEAYESYGNEILYSGTTGEQIESSIFIGPVFYMRLKHMVKDKQQSRCLGPRSVLTKQPVGGRANEGGLRIGEMERDSVVAHGAMCFLNESMMERGDKYNIAVCNKSGMLAIYNPTKNVFMSPMADGPLKFLEDKTDEGNTLRIDTVTKFGRDFSVVEIPYTLKLMIQELQTINVQLRIITEDNINQIENLSYKTIPETANEYIKKLEKIVREAERDQDKELSQRIQEAIASPSSINSDWVVKSDKDTMLYEEGSSAENDVGYPEGYFDSSKEEKKDTEPWEDEEYDYSHLLSSKPKKNDEWKIRSKPPSPNEAPQWTIKGGELDQDQYQDHDHDQDQDMLSATSYMKGDFVHLQGDNIPNRIWVIDEIKQNPHSLLYTLLTNDTNQLNMNDRIQIVKGDRLIPVQTDIHAQAPSMDYSNMGENHSAPPQIVFSPIMINGNGNTGGDGTQPGQDPYQDYSTATNAPPPIPLSSMSSSGKMSFNNNNKEKSEPEPNSKSGGGKNWIQSAIDWTADKLLVKKLG
jgi:DNA-directed RNA polymerase II subunit RPB2